MDIVQDYKRVFTDFLHSHTFAETINEGVVRLTTPLLDFENDAIELYIDYRNDEIRVTDDGETLRNLAFSGFTFERSDYRQKILRSILSNHGVQMNESQELFVKVTESTLAPKMYMLTQCMQKVSDLFLLSKTNVVSLFMEEVHEFLVENRIRFIPELSFVGKSNLTTVYDFAIPSSEAAPERLIQTVNNLQLQQAKSILFGWEDTRENRVRSKSELIVIYNDLVAEASDNTLSAIHEYGGTSIGWSNRQDYIGQLSA